MPKHVSNQLLKMVLLTVTETKYVVYYCHMLKHMAVKLLCVNIPMLSQPDSSDNLP